eukprot:XP_020404720.1 glycine-rich protein DOT1-like [Zea mays]
MGKGRRGRGSPCRAGDKRKRDPSPPSEDFGDSEYSEEEGLAAEVWTYICSVERVGLEGSDESEVSSGEENSSGSSEERSGDDSDDEGGSSSDGDGGEGDDDGGKGSEGDDGGDDGGKGDSGGVGSGSGKASGKAPLV